MIPDLNRRIATDGDGLGLELILISGLREFCYILLLLVAASQMII